MELRERISGPYPLRCVVAAGVAADKYRSLVFRKVRVLPWQREMHRMECIIVYFLKNCIYATQQT